MPIPPQGNNVGVSVADDEGNAAVYQANPIAENAGIAPPWFAAAVAGAVAQAVAPFEANLAEVLSVAYVAYNLQCGDGSDLPFKIIPFANGNNPTIPPHNLPALTSKGDITALTGP